MNKKNQKGFTLVELIVVIAIVAILASVAIVGYTQFITNARESKAKAEMDQIYNVMYADAVGEGITIDGAVTLTVDNNSKLVITVLGDDNTAAITALTGRYLSAEFGEGSKLNLIKATEEPEAPNYLEYTSKDEKVVKKELGSTSVIK